MTVGPYETYIGGPVESFANEVLQMDTRHMVSLMIDFIPIVGQVKGLVEGIIGRDLITGDELPNWARGLSILLAIIPEAHGVISSGEAGVKALARVAVDSGKDADKVYRAVKVAGRLSEDEVKAAEKIVAGARPNAAQVKMARALEEIETGQQVVETHLKEVTTEAAKGLATGLEKMKRTVRLAGKDHTLSLKRVGNEIRVWLCSNGCGEVMAKAEAMLAKLPAKHAARAELEEFIKQVRKEANWIDVAPAEEKAQKALAEFEQTLEAIDKRYPGAVDPEVPVATQPAKSAAAEGAGGAERAYAHLSDTDLVKRVAERSLDTANPGVMARLRARSAVLRGRLNNRLVEELGSNAVREHEFVVIGMSAENVGKYQFRAAGRVWATTDPVVAEIFA